VFNTAKEIKRKLQDAAGERGAAAAERAAVKRDTAAAAAKGEIARGGDAGWMLG
jgi:hypothetical protein